MPSCHEYISINSDEENVGSSAFVDSSARQFPVVPRNRGSF